MAGSRYKVECCLCGEIFDNDYIKKHTSIKHDDLSKQFRIAPTQLPKSKAVKNPWEAAARQSVAKKIRIEESCVDVASPVKAIQITTNNDDAAPEEDDTWEIEDSDESEESDTGDEENDPARLIYENTTAANPASTITRGEISSIQLCDVSKSCCEDPRQPIVPAFPKHIIGNSYRSFKSYWYEKFKWLEYSVSRDAVFCFHCRHFNPDQSNVFLTGGFRLWKKCHGKDKKDNRFLQHQLSTAHAESVLKYDTFIKIKSSAATQTSISTALSEAHAKTVKENRHYIRTLCEVLKLTAERRISQRETAASFRIPEIDSENLDFGPYCGNFLSFLSIIGHHDPIIAERLKHGPRNAKYTHHSIQNALIGIMAEMILDEIRSELNMAQYFTILADESKDLSKKEQVAIVFRYVFENNIHEELVGISEAISLNANGLAETILSHANNMQVNMHLCVAQGYDGASVVSGHLSGVNAIIRKSSAPLAVYIHCFSHRLNLVIVDVVKAISTVGETLSFLQRLYVFMSGSSVHARWVNLQKVDGLHVMELKRLSDTRWACQSAMLSTVCKRIHTIYFLLADIIDNDTVSDRVTDARGLLLQIDRDFLRKMFALNHIFKLCKQSSDFLQNATNSLADATDIIKNLSDNLQACRNEETCQKFCSSADKFSDELNLKERTRPARKRTLPAMLKDTFVSAPVETNRTENTFLTFRSNIYLVIDRIEAEINRRFSSENVIIMRGISALTPKSESFLNFDIIKPFAEHYQCNLEDLKLEVSNCVRLLARKEDSPCTLLEFHQYISRLKDAFNELDRLIRISCTLPVSTTECERCFSTLRLVKTHLRTCMCNPRLNNLMIMGVHRARSKKLDLDKVVDRFILKFPRCRISLV